MTEVIRGIVAAAARLETTQGGDGASEWLGLYRCWRPQEIRDVMMPDATVLLVLRGRKELVTASQSWTAGPGEVLLVPAGSAFWLGNYPEAPGQGYRGLAVRFSVEVVAQFRQIYGQQLDRFSLQGRWHALAPDDFLHAVRQWLTWCADRAPDRELARHRLVELLLLLARAHLAGNLLLAEHPSWSRRVTGLLHLDPARPWRMEEVGSRLGVSESTLRRRLQDEGKGFRTLLEEVRLIHGLTLVQESAWSIGRIADAVGYRSQSRFSERFKRRFGLTPRSLRNTIVPEIPSGSFAGTAGESGEISTD